MATQKFTSFDKFFLMHADMTAVTIKSNKIDLSEVKDTKARLEPSYRKKLNECFGQPNMDGIQW